MTKKQRKRLDAIKVYRRRSWGSKCQLCGDRWHKGKTNYLIEKSGTCQYCMAYVAKVMGRGAAWLLKRRSTLNFWDDRLGKIGGKSKRTRRAA
jgi:hypothetical protein